MRRFFLKYKGKKAHVINESLDDLSCLCGNDNYFYYERARIISRIEAVQKGVCKACIEAIKKENERYDNVSSRS
jgi:hypothetical protein